MKRVNKIVLLFLVGLFALGLFSACDDRTKDVDAYCIFDDQRLRLNISFDNAYTSGDYSSFYTDSTLGEIKDQIDGLQFSAGSVETELYGSLYILIKYTTNDEVLHYFMVTNHREGGYVFDCPNGYVSGTTWLVPYHLMGDEYDAEVRSSHYQDSLKEDIVYATEYTFQDFYDFYAPVAEYEMDATDDSITLTYATDDETKTIQILFGETEDGLTTVEYTAGE